MTRPALSAKSLFVTLVLFSCISWADEYVISIDSNKPRLANVVATITPDGNEVGMNEFNEHGLINGWATYVADGRETRSDQWDLTPHSA